MINPPTVPPDYQHARKDPRKPNLRTKRMAAGIAPEGGGTRVGRPPRGAYDPATAMGQREMARAKAAAQLDRCVEFFVAVRDGLIMATSEQIRAAENLCDRGGFPRKTDLELSTEDGAVKLWSLGTYRTKDGAHHELPRDTTGDTPEA